MTIYLITGSSRSLGLGYLKELLAADSSNKVIAAVRNPDRATQLEPVQNEYGDRLYLLKCDVTDVKSTQVSNTHSPLCVRSAITHLTLRVSP
jgi:NAD(P)-dependent dehydrogenase (short-subunit alcohol dehydrogenase family)